ncbi:MAG: acetyl-CoA C-acetyltransferase, partial [Syntrophomonadaceae bacterium]
MQNVVIVAAARTAVGDFQGSLASLKGHELGTLALKGTIDKFGIDP